MLFAFDTSDDEDAFLNVASYVDHALSPVPTWKLSPCTASSLICGYYPRPSPGKGCHWRDWSLCNFFSKAVPGISCK